MKRYLFVALIALGTMIPAHGQVVNCPSGFASSGACGVGTGQAFPIFGDAGTGAGLSGSTIDLQPTGANHAPNSIIYQTAVSTRAFTTTFKFSANAWNIAFVLENATTNGGAGPSPPLTLAQSFTSGAGCEGGFYQAFGGSGHPPPNNIFALNFDSGNLLVNSLSPFYSNVQIYQQIQSPCIPDDGQAWFYYTNKVSTSPVAMNSPATTYQTTTGDTYSATIIYTGTNLVLNMYNVSAGGTCSPATSSTCFTYTWQGVNIPSLVDGTTAYLGFTGSTNANSPRPLTLNSLTYSALSAASAPTVSPSSGTYGSTQSVAISDASPGSVICYNTTGAPSTNGQAGCTNGTVYTGAISVPSGQTIYAVAGGSGYADSAIGIAAYRIGSTASQPTFYPAQGTYQGHQTVFLSAAQGSVICYNTTGSPATNGATGCTTGTLYTGPITVSSNETIYAVAGGTGFSGDSVAGSAAYIISPFAVVDGFTASYPANSPTYSPIPGTYSGTQSVTLSTTTPGAYICYIASSTPPTLLPETNNLGACSVGTRYSSPIAVASTETIYAIASTTVGANVAGTGPPSSLVQGSYTIASSGGTTASTPTFSPVAGTYTATQSVTLSTTSPGATICYNTTGSPATNGTSGCNTGTLYTGPVTVSSSETLYAAAGGTGFTDSSVGSASYVIQSTVATPAFSPAGGTYTSAQSVSISDGTSGATIYYTSNGTTPTTSSTKYTGPITVSSTETLEAMAAAAGDTNSGVASATYTITPVVATPTFSPAAGTYTSAQSVTLSNATSGATMYYTTNGTTPTTSSTKYTGPITVSSTETVQAMAAATGDTNSAVGSASYTINVPVVATPTFSLAAGTYTSAQTVSLSDATSGATIYYTTNGTTPTTSSIAYSGPITVSSTETVQAMAAATGDTNSAVASATYTITPVVATPTFSLPAGTYTSAQTVSLSDVTSGATIYYTTNGTAPTTSSTKYIGPITVSSTETVQAMAAATGDTNSAVASATYTITPVVATPTFSLPAGTYTSAQTVSLSDATSGATIYYTTNGTTPTTSSSAYIGPITVSSTETVQAMASATGDTNSAVASATYTITPVVATPAFSPAAGTYTAAQTVSISDATSGATIYYTTNGTAPTTSSTKYTGPITVSSTETLEAMATATGDTNSAVASAAYTINLPVVATPAFSLASGTYASAQTVSLSDATSGATIYYTTNGTTPTTSSTKYTGPITVSSTETLQAIAVATGDTNSAVASATYTITATVATPTFSLPSGTYTSAQTVSLADATSGATIYYTTNGTTPSTSSTTYGGPITVSSTETVQAMAAATGDTNSAVTSATYTITPVVATPTFSPAAGTYTSAQTVTLSDATSGATIYYTTNGTTPTTSSTAYAGPITVSVTETLQALAAATGDTNSAVASAAYTITATVATPTFAPAAGAYSSAQTVTLSDATSGATIYYTTNGTTPTTSSTVYSGPITVSATETLQAMAAATGDANSAVASAAYTITATVATPTFSPAAGTYGSAQLVTVSDTTSGATIYYTINGTTPNTTSTAYSGPITVSVTETLQAIAVATGDTNSAVASAAYTITSSSQATNFAIGTTVQQAAVKHLGINIGGQNYYDSGQISRNLTVRNPGFEAEMWSSILNCQAATATTCTDSDPNTVWPANFLQGATFQVIYGAANGQSGTVAGSTVSNSSANTGITLTFAAPLSPAPATGDVIKVRMQVPGNPQAGWWVSTSGGATFSADTTDLSPETPGKQALAINAAGSGQSATINSYFDSYSGRSFVQLNGTYTVTFRAKGVSGSNQMNVSVARLGIAHGNVTYLNQNVTLTSQWQDYSYTFNAAEDGTYVGTAGLTFGIAGAQIYLDDVALTEPAAVNNPTAFRNAVVDTLKTLQPGVLRFMDGGADFASTTDNMIAVPFARLRAGYGEGQTEQDDISLGLNDFLVLCQAVGAEPWYTVPAGIAPADMQNLIQFLASDASTPYGTIRSSLGQSAPWTSVFPTIHLELGNEVWNSGSFAGEAIPNATAYGNVAATAFAAARASSAYDPSKFDLVLGSWAAEPSWTAQELTNSSGYDSVDVAPYLFNSLNDYGSNEAIFGPMFAQPEQVDSSTASGNYMYQQAQAAAAGSAPAKLAVYEVNLSTTSGTAPQTQVNQAAAGLGAGIAVADHMLLMMRDLGITTQNMFALPEYVNGFNNTQGGNETVPLWGSVIDMGGETNLKRPQFFALQLANSAIFPTMLATTVSGSNPTWNQPLSTNDSIQLANAHSLQSFAFTNGTQSSVVVFNLSRSGSLPVTFSGVNAPSGNVVISQLTSTNPTDNNEGLFTNTPVVAGPTQTTVANFNPATPYSLPPYSMTVFSTGGTALAASTTTLQASPLSATAGQNVALTATVSSQSATTTPTGTVTFYNGSTSLGTATLGSAGQATLNTTTLPVGSDSITAAYGGDSNDAGSTSSPVIVTITAAVVPTNTVLKASATGINVGQSVTFTATVSPQSGSNVATGTVTFLDGTTSLGTALVNASGVATLSTTALPVGTQTITASYGGDSKDSSSVSNAVSVVVTQAAVATTTTLTASATQITIGQSVGFTAKVVAQSGNGVPGGTVTFFDGTTSLGKASLNASGTATLSTTALTAGTHSITASYFGNSIDSGSVSQVVTVVVGQSTVATTTGLTASAAQIAAGQSVTFTATVTPQSGSNVATGTVTFLDGTITLGTAQLNARGVATFSLSTLPAGTNSITASYAGDSKDNGSVSQAVSVVVGQNAVATTTRLTAGATQITIGQSVAFTAKVVAQSGSVVPGGTVTFFDGTTSLGKASLNSGGTATLSTTALTAGTHSITASYFGNGTDSSSVSNAVSVVVGPSTVATTTALTALPVVLASGQSVTFTAAVTPQAGSNVATGTVTFLNGTTPIGTAQLNSSGVATLSTSTLPTGANSITAAYGGDSKDSASVSQAVTVTVTTAPATAGTPTTTNIWATATHLTFGQALTFTAIVVPQVGSTVPTGTVTFADAGTNLATVTLDASGMATFQTTSLAVGTHLITAAYAGNGNSSSSVSEVLPIFVVASPTAIASSTTTLMASATQLTAGQSVTFTATVAEQSSSKVATGNVTFLDGSTSLGTGQLNSSGVATFTTASLAIGTHSISADYGGDGNISPSTSPVITVNVATAAALAPGYAMVVSSSAVTLYPGQPSNLTITLIPEAGFNLPISLTCSGLPQGTICKFNPSSVTPGGAPAMSTATIMAPAETALTPKEAPGSPLGRLAFGWVLPWGFIPVLGLAKTRKRSKISQWSFRLAVVAALTIGSLWVTGCGYSANGKAFTATITASTSNAQIHSTQITVHFQP